jgi:alkanesulfonate monooxygenase SsuD/methylene tetrahydromethanopterin reductase-like flavin-dependent oxidoreductase (luciferase family)
LLGRPWSESYEHQPGCSPDDLPHHTPSARDEPKPPIERQAGGGDGKVVAGVRGAGGMVNAQEHEEMIRQYEATLTKLREDHARRLQDLCAQVLPPFPSPIPAALAFSSLPVLPLARFPASEFSRCDGED